MAGIAVSSAQTIALAFQNPETIMGSEGAVAVVTVSSVFRGAEVRFGLEVPANVSHRGESERTVFVAVGTPGRLEVGLNVTTSGDYVFRAWLEVGSPEMYGRTATQIWRGLRVNATGVSEFYAYPQASALELELICEIPEHLYMIAALSVDEPIRGTLFFSHQVPLVRGNEREDVDLAAGEMKRWAYKPVDGPWYEGGHYQFTVFFYPDASQDTASYESSCYYQATSGTLHFVGK